MGWWGPPVEAAQWADVVERLPSGSRLYYCAPATGPAVELPDGITPLSTDGDGALAALRALHSLDNASSGKLLLQHTQAALPPLAVERLSKALTSTPSAVAVSPLGNTHQRLWPLPSSVSPDSIEPAALDQFAFAYGERMIFPLAAVSETCSLWRFSKLPTTELTQSTSLADLAKNLTAANQQLLAIDHLYVHQPDAGPVPDKASQSDPLDRLRVVLGQAVNNNPAPPITGLTARPAQLHILHDWGGGVAQWVADIARSQADRDHLLLVAHGASGEACGQELRLFVGSTNSTPLAVWPLPQPIASTAIEHADYRAALEQIITSYGVTQLVVSSLIGHSLDCLKTGLPTELMLHDFYPAWPLLDIAFETAPAQQLEIEALQQQLDAGRDTLFGDKQARHWQQLRDCYLAAIQSEHVVCAAPSQSVVDGLIQLDRRFAKLDIALVGHGLAPWPAHAYRYRQADDLDQRRLRLLVPGRITAGKGKQLLLDALPDLHKLADIYLLGAGKDGEDFLGISGVHVVMQYDRDQLPGLLTQLQPDCALLLSTVSETFSYTLSEMQSLNIPVIANAVGSLKERLADTPDSLIAPQADTLVAAIAQLRGNPQRLAKLLAATSKVRSLTEMALEHSRVFPAQSGNPLRYALQTASLASETIAVQTRSLDQTSRSNQKLTRQLKQRQRELEKSSEWGFGLQRKLQDRTEWAKSLESDLADAHRVLAELREEFDERTAWALRLQHELTSSHSWRLTKPLRFVARKARALKGRLNFHRSRAQTLAKRTRNSLQVRGVRGTLDRIGSEFRQRPAESAFAVPKLAELALDQPLSFPSVEAPTASIIIPAYNHFKHTWGCLRSLLDAQTSTSFEVIVIDDESNDQTSTCLTQFSGITYLRNERNLGFIGSCNRGAGRARGEFVVFLNNDTAVGDGWLDALLKTFIEHTDAGLVGARLVYPDGTLQEAGGIVFADGSGWNYGRNEDPTHPAYNYVREVDYCSGACIALRRELWQQLGGFDSRYAPAYYEDTDLAMQVRTAGLKVYYQPDAVVTHFEGVTSGTDTSSGTKQYQVINQQNFLAKWGEVLSASHPPAGSSIRYARDHRHPKQALIIDACTPTPDQDSGSVRMTNLMRLLRELGYQVAFLADNRAFVEGYTQRLQQLGVEMFYQPHVPTPAQLLKEIGAELDLVILSRHYVASQHIDAVRWHCTKARVLFDTVDLHYLREQRLAQLDNDTRMATTAEQTRKEELGVAARCDTTLVVSSLEKEVLATDAPELSVSVLSNIHQLFGCRRPFKARRDLFFVGGFQHPPNIDAISWFVDEVWPLIHRQLPAVQFYIIGSRAPQQLRHLSDRDGVLFKGFVENIEPYLDGCRLAIAPLRYGAGVKGKVNMSMSYGQPVIATPAAIEGMFVESGREVLVADDATTFADAVLRAYHDETLWNQLSEQGLKNVEEHFSFDAARRALGTILEA